MLADALVIFSALLLACVALTQVLVPLLRGEPLFRSFRKNYQRERLLQQQLAQAKRELAEMELEKQVAEHRNELLRRRLEQIDSFSSLASTPVITDDPVGYRREDTPEKEH